jgi:hypothetical protein
MRSSLPPPPLPSHAQQGSVASTVRALAAGTRPSEVWRTAAFALLRLNPQECEHLGKVFEEEAATDEIRLIVLDLLGGAGSFEAQVVMRRLLSLSVARRDNRTFASFVQRLGFVESPDGPTLRFLMSVYAESRNEPVDVRASCAYALGAASGQAFTCGEPDAAVRASDCLRRDLMSATAPAEKCALLAALGNAGITSDITVITRFAQDADPWVRAGAALALRKLNVVEARQYLVMLVADHELKVAHSALAALAEHKLDDQDLECLSEHVLAGQTPITLDMRILRLIVAQRPRLSSVPGQGCAVENALRLLLGRVEAAGSGERISIGPGERHSFVAQPAAKFPSASGMKVASGSGSVPAMPAAALVAPVAPTPIPAAPLPMSVTPPPTPFVPKPPVAAAAPVTPEPETRRVDVAPTVLDHVPLSLAATRVQRVASKMEAAKTIAMAPARPATKVAPNAVRRG